MESMYLMLLELVRLMQFLPAIIRLVRARSLILTWQISILFPCISATDDTTDVKCNAVRYSITSVVYPSATLGTG